MTFSRKGPQHLLRKESGRQAEGEGRRQTPDAVGACSRHRAAQRGGKALPPSAQMTAGSSQGCEQGHRVSGGAPRGDPQKPQTHGHLPL